MKTKAVIVCVWLVVCLSAGSLCAVEVPVDGVHESAVPFEVPEGQNPFAEDVRVEVTRPDGSKVEVAAFWYQAYNASVDKNGMEHVQAVGKPGFRVRFAPRVPGVFSWLAVWNGNTAVLSNFTAVSSTRTQGFLSLNSRGRLVESGGAQVLPMGVNMAWAGQGGTADYAKWLDLLTQNGGSWIRVWVGPLGFTLEFREVGKYELDHAWQLDQVMDMARKMGVWVIMSVTSFNSWRSTPPYDMWSKNPYQTLIGKPEEFFVDDKAMDAFERRLEYIVARYGAYSSLWSVELFNEVDLVDKYYEMEAIGVVKRWHERMYGVIEAADVNGHLHSTSFSNSKGSKGIQALEGTSFTTTHTYGSSDFGGDVHGWVHAKAVSFKKGTLVEEYGLGDPTTAAEKDPSGIALHTGMMSSIASGAVAGAGMWWWDNYITPKGLWGRFGGPSAVAKLVAGVMNEGMQEVSLVSSTREHVGVLGLTDNEHSVVWIRDTRFSYSNASEALALNGTTVFFSAPMTSACEVVLVDTSTGEQNVCETCGCNEVVIPASKTEWMDVVALQKRK